MPSKTRRHFFTVDLFKIQQPQHFLTSKLSPRLSTVNLAPPDLMAHTYFGWLTCALQIHPKRGFPLSPCCYVSVCVWNQSQRGIIGHGLSSARNPLVGFSNPLLLINFQVTSSPKHHRSILTEIYRSKMNLHATASFVFLC